MTAVSILIAAAGRGKRLGKGRNKTLISVGGVPILARTVSVFQNMDEVREIIIVTGSGEIDEVREIVHAGNFSKVKGVFEGGETRQLSVVNGLRHVTCPLVGIHDGARPFVTAQTARRTFEAAEKYGAAVACVPVTDTIKVTDDGFVTDTPQRSKLFAAQTPQAFKTELIRRAYANAAEKNISLTDDASAAEAMGVRVAVVEGSAENVKITAPRDLEAFEMSVSKTPRVGFGIDVHKLASGRKCILGGVEIEHETGLLGHSDADVLLHAISDALLGAAALGDIGKHFPDTDPAYEGISSIKLLECVRDLIEKNGCKIINIDSTVACQAPKLAPHIDKMRQNIAVALKIDVWSVSVKATTTEKLGYEGSGEGITAYAVAMILG